MAFTTELAGKLTRDASPGPQKSEARIDYWAQRFVEADLAAVHLFARSARPKVTRILAISISKLGNGWIYLPLALFVFASFGWDGRRIAALAMLNAALLHTLYPILKRRFGRKRPFHADASLPSLLKTLDALLKTLDESSFPSGHAMTLTGVLAPIVLAWPAMTASAIAMICAMAWSRIATAHHYPSDVVAGVALGAGVAYPLSACALAMI